MVFVREKRPEPAPSSRPLARKPMSIVIIGGGGAGLAAADMLRREGYDGPITMISADDAPPSNRPNLSKDYLAGTAQDDWIPLREIAEYLIGRRIELMLSSRVSSLDVKGRQVVLGNGARRTFDSLLIATNHDRGAPAHLRRGRSARALSRNPSRMRVPSSTRPRRPGTLVVVGSKFHRSRSVGVTPGARGSRVDVVTPDHVPLERGHGTRGRTLHSNAARGAGC